jgi:hypothetical protein
MESTVNAIIIMVVTNFLLSSLLSSSVLEATCLYREVSSALSCRLFFTIMCGIKVLKMKGFFLFRLQNFRNNPIFVSGIPNNV